MTIRAVLCLFACLGALTSAALAGSTAHELRFSNADDVTTLDPVVSAETTVGLLSQLTMAYLVRYDARNRPRPELATEIPTRRNGGISRDGLTITWHLRRDARWSDGVPFDASDVAFTVAAILDPANRVASREGFDDIVRVETPDRWTSVFHLERPYAGFLPRFFGSPPGNPCLLPKHVLAALSTIDRAPYDSMPIGIGPFRYVTWNRGQSIVMEANPMYFRGVPALRRVTFEIVPDEAAALSQLQAGDIDLLLNVKAVDLPRAETIPGAVIASRPSYRFVALAFNTQRPQVADPEVRLALEMAIDRRTLVAKVDHGLGSVAQSFVPPSYAGARPISLIAFDPRRANALLDAAGWRQGSDGTRSKAGRSLTVELDSVAGAYPETVELLRTWWTSIGVSVATRTFAAAAFYRPDTGVAFGGHFDATIYSIQNFPFVDPSLIFACDRIPPGGLNLTRFCDRKLDAVISEYETTYDVASQAAELQTIATDISALTPLIVLEYAQTIFVRRRSVVGFHPNEVTFFDDVMRLDVR